MVSNAAGSATSEEATLTVVDPGGQVVLADGDPIEVASDGTNVYWTDGLRVNAASVNCSGPIRTLYERFQFWENVIGLGFSNFSPGRVVWTDTVSGSVRSISTDGGPPITLASGLGSAQIHDVAVGNGRAFWPHQLRGIQTVALDGGAVSTLASGRINAGGIAVDDLYVYWTDLEARTVKRVPLGGGEVTVLAEGQEYPNSIVSGGQSVYWSTATNHDTDQPTGYVMKVGRDGGTPVVLASQPTLIAGIALDTSFIYWTGGLLKPGVWWSVSRAPLDGSEPPSLLASSLDFAGAIALDSRYVYWSDSRGVMRLQK